MKICWGKCLSNGTTALNGVSILSFGCLAKFDRLPVVYIPMNIFRLEGQVSGIGRLAPPFRLGSPYALDTFRSEPTVASRPKGRAHTPLVNRYLRHLVCVPWIRLRSSRLPLACDPAPWYALQ